MNLTSSKSKYFYLGLFLIAAFGIVFSQIWTFGNKELSSSVLTQPEIALKPDQANMKLYSTYTLTTNVSSETGVAPVKVTWSMSAKDKSGKAIKVPKDVYLEKCNISTCKFHSGGQQGNIIITARADGKEAKSNIIISEELPTIPYTDNISGDFAKKVLASLYDKGIMKGNSKGSFDIMAPTSRAEAIEVFFNMTNFYGIDTATLLAKKKCNVYPDIKSNHPSYKAICFANMAGWLKKFSFPGGNFNPAAKVTRSDLALLLFNMLHTRIPGADDTNNDQFPKDIFGDINLQTPNALEILETQKMGIITLERKGKLYYFHPEWELTRGTLAGFVFNTMTYLETTSPSLYNS